MRDRLTLKIEQNEGWFVGSCPEVPGANGQGRTLMSCSRNLVQAIALMLDEDLEPVVSHTTVTVDVLGQSTAYPVQLVKSWEGIAVCCTDLSGCHSQGDDEEEALNNIRDAIKDYLEVAEELRHERASQLVKVA